MDALNTESEPNVVIRRYLIIWWTLTTMLAMGLAAFITEWIGFQYGIVEGTVTGLVVGAVQWALLRASAESVNLWPLLTTAAWALVGLMSAEWPIWAGAWIGMLQWIALRGYHRTAGWWVSASAGGWFATWMLAEWSRLFLTRGLRASLASAVLGSDAFTSLPFYLITALNWALGGIVYAFVTGVMLAAILDPTEA
jgi:hypothetical protein